MDRIEIKLIDGPICDFCSCTPVVAQFKCNTFGDSTSGVMSHGDWAACETCRDMIVREQWVELTQRSFQEFRKRYGNDGPDAVLMQDLEFWHLGFRTNRTSKSPEPVGGQA